MAAASPAMTTILPSPSGEHFSELWLLDSRRGTEDYPFNVMVGEEYKVFVGVWNHIGRAGYYMIYVKLRNQVLPLPDISNSTPSPLSPLYEFRFFVPDEEISEFPLTFKILKGSVQYGLAFLGDISINGMPVSVNAFSMWDPRNEGFYYQLFLELWLYDMPSQSFQYHNRFVGIWLNMTSS